MFSFPLQFFVTDYYDFELWEIYQIIFDAHYGKFMGMNHGGRREVFLEREK